MTELLRLAGWTVRMGPQGGRPLLQELDLSVAAGEAVALVGPSGSGKSLTALSACGLLPAEARTAGSVSWRGREVGVPGGLPWFLVRGKGVTLVQQEPAGSLNPVLTVGAQIAETVQWHGRCGAAAARRRALDLLAEVRMPDPERCYRAWPHELSGGMQQRALLAAALACEPELLVADEPTTALDPTVQAAIVALIDELRRRRGMALLFISHDRDLVSLLTERVVALAEGRLTTETPTAARPPTPDAPAGGATPPVLQGQDLHLSYPGATAPAVAGVDLSLRRGEIVGLAGESGCGKTSLARLLSGHVRPGGGRVLLEAADLAAARGRNRRALRRRVQLLFQAAGESLDPRQTVGACLREAAEGRVSLTALLAEVGLTPELAERLPHQLSGGQRQRVALARCLAVQPDVVIADEPARALDTATRQRVLALLVHAAAARRLAVIVISHDLDELAALCHRVLVMLGGVVVEELPSASGAAPRHPYTRSLQAAQPARLAAVTGCWQEGAAAGGRVRPADASACPFRHACELVKPICHNELPPLAPVGEGHAVRCPVISSEAPPQFIDT